MKATRAMSPEGTWGGSSVERFAMETEEHPAAERALQEKDGALKTAARSWQSSGAADKDGRTVGMPEEYPRREAAGTHTMRAEHHVAHRHRSPEPLDTTSRHEGSRSTAVVARERHQSRNPVPWRRHLGDGQPRSRIDPGSYKRLGYDRRQAQKRWWRPGRRSYPEPASLVMKMCSGEFEGNVHVGHLPTEVLNMEHNLNLGVSIQVSCFASPVDEVDTDGFYGKVLPDCIPVTIQASNRRERSGDLYKYIDFFYNSARHGNNILFHCMTGVTRGPAVATIATAIMLQVDRWAAYSSINEVRAVKDDSQGIVEGREWDRLLRRRPTVWPVAEVWTMAQDTSTTKGKLVHAAKEGLEGVHRGVPNTLCEIMRELPPAQHNPQRIVNSLGDAKTWHGASYVCRECMNYLPASQLVQVFKVFKEADPYVRRCAAGGYEYREPEGPHYHRLNLRED